MEQIERRRWKDSPRLRGINLHDGRGFDRCHTGTGSLGFPPSFLGIAPMASERKPPPLASLPRTGTNPPRPSPLDTAGNSIMRSDPLRAEVGQVSFAPGGEVAGLALFDDVLDAPGGAQATAPAVVG